MQEPKSNTTRFSDRVADYVRYRPMYPVEIIAQLEQLVGLTPAFTIADIGSGTGLSAQRFVEAGNLVYGVEPNFEMRQASQTFFQGNRNFKAIEGTAEQTNLVTKAIDLIFCGQAFHWFDAEQAKLEFDRILKPKGVIVLAWNERSTTDPLQQDYEQMMRKLIPEYAKVTQRNIEKEQIRSFLSPRNMEVVTLPNQQIFNLEELKGRLLSSSYVPKEGEEHHGVVMQALEAIFDQYQDNGRVVFNYETQLYIGKG